MYDHLIAGHTARVINCRVTVMAKPCRNQMCLQALRLFPAVVIVPTMQISWTLFSVISGGIYYEEYKAFTPFTASMFALGVLVCLPTTYYSSVEVEIGNLIATHLLP